MPSSSLNVLLVSAEVAPFAKVGGLADVAGALPKALSALGHDVRVMMPCYKMVEDQPAYGVRDLLGPTPLTISPSDVRQAWVRQTTIGGTVPVYLVGGHPHYAEATESKRVYSLDADPYVFLNRAVVELLPSLAPGWRPDVIHCNDWHTGLTPVYLDLLETDDPVWAGTARVFTIHNMAYQGEFGHELLSHAGLPERLFNMEELEFYGHVSFMKGGLVFADAVNTVSQTYAREIQTPEYGCRLEGLLQLLASRGRLTGIVNGIDYDEYDPATDPRIPARFSAADRSGKRECKARLQEECGLPVREDAALIGIVSRLADQKGFDLIHDVARHMMALPLQLVVLGTGDPRYETYFRGLHRRHPERVSAHIGFDAGLAQRIYAGSDMFLMPSRFEPCGLGQLMSLRYGTIPVVRATGGLVDTIQDYDPQTGEGNGFSFAEYNADRLYACIERALGVFADRAQWLRLVGRALLSDNSWSASARQYEALYRSAGAARKQRAALE